MRFGFIGRGRRRTGFDVLDAARRIRAYLDSKAVLRAAAREVERAVPGSTAEIWLTTGRGRPTRAVPPAGPDDPVVPKLVAVCARRRRPVAGDFADAAPIFAPRGGLLGVVYCVGRQSEFRDLHGLSLLAIEAGYALEAATLYEQALAERDKADAILSRVGDAVVVTDAAGTIRAWNRGAHRATGHATETAVGKRCGDMLGLHLDERRLDCESGCPLLAVRAADAVLGVEVWRERADGRRQPLLADASAVLDSDGNIGEVVHSLRDVTRLKEADEAKTLFLATASHELRTPLAVIQGFGQTLLTLPDMGQDDRERALQAMVGRSRQLNKIVDRLLLSSRIEAGRSDVRPEPVDVGGVVVERGRSLADAAGVEVEVEVPDDLPLALADPDALATVLDHLLENATKYSDGKPVRVRVEDSDAAVTVSVSDEGIGMDDEQVARCFEKFWQAESSDVRRYGGTGIGLFIVRSLVESMRGKVGVRSVSGQGSTFWFTLPLPGHVEQAPPAAPVPGIGERSMAREFMRQLGIPARRQS